MNATAYTIHAQIRDGACFALLAAVIIYSFGFI